MWPGFPPGKLMLCWLWLLLAGCTGLGPHAIYVERNAYNQAIQNSNDEQLLLNLVRVKYRDTPFFLELNSVSAQYSLATGGSAQLTFPEAGHKNRALNLKGDYYQRPTISYTPLRGDQFIKRLLAPLTLEKILLLTRSGWRIDQVLRVCAQRINDLKNAPLASGPTPEREPEFHDFMQLMRLLARQQTEDDLHISFANDKHTPRLVIDLDPNPASLAERRKTLALLSLPEDASHFELMNTSRGNNGTSRRGIDTRSLLGMMFYLSQGVEIPREHIARGLVTRTHSADGTTFDWARVTGDLFQIHSSADYPEDAAVAVKYRGYWFYIKDTDLDSKSTFAMLSQIFSLQAASKPQSLSPMLTLPLGQ